MVRIYLSPSTQPRNLYYGGKNNEETVCNQITDVVIKELSKYKVDVIRGSIKQPTTERIVEANKLAVDYYLAIHTNAGGGRGCETFYQNGTQVSLSTRAKSKNYASILNTAISSITTTNLVPGDRGIKFKLLPSGALKGQDWNHELRGVSYPANLVEYEFHDTVAGAKWILENIDLIGQTTAESIAHMFNLELKEEIPDEDFYYVQTGAYKTVAEAEAEAKKLAKHLKSEVGIKYGSKFALKWIKGVK